MTTTTLNRIRAASPCADGWKKLLAGLNKTEADDQPLPLVTILDINGIEDAIWALRCIDDQERARQYRYELWCARADAQVIAEQLSRAERDAARAAQEAQFRVMFGGET